jgi:hypothetical protein
MKPATGPVDGVLRAWPRLRGYFSGRTQLAEAELLAFFQEAVPAVTAATWPAVRQGLLRSQLLHEVGPGLLAFEAPPAGGLLKPVLPPEWRAVWTQLADGLALPLGCLWSTRWLQPFLPELRGAQRLLAAASLPDPVVVRAWQRFSPVRQVRGIPTARLEKMLVDAALVPELAGATSDAALTHALILLQAGRLINQELLLSYAARCEAHSRWFELLRVVRVPD